MEFDQFKHWQQSLLKTSSATSLSELTDHSIEGLDIEPAYFRPDSGHEVDQAFASAPLAKWPADMEAGWDIRQSYRHPDPAAANQQILADLENRATSIHLILDPTGKMGIAASSLDDLDRLLDKVDLELAPLSLCPTGADTDSAALLLAWLQKSGFNGSKIAGCIGLSPIANATRRGYSPVSLDLLSAQGGEIAVFCAENFPDLRIFTIDTLLVHEVLGSAEQELGMTAAAGSGYMRRLMEAGLSSTQAAQKVNFSYGVDSDILINIAKLRAARLIWAKITAEFGVDDPQAASMDIHALTSRRMLTHFDPWTNHLRNSAALFAAICGGADHITVNTFTRPLGLASDEARRAARNTQLVAALECNAGFVADPGHGSFAIEKMTKELAEKAWALFQEIEKRGGMAAVARSGWLQPHVLQTAQKREEAFLSGKKRILGVTRHANPTEQIPATLPKSQTNPPLQPGSEWREDASLQTRIDEFSKGAPWVRSTLPAETLTALKPQRLSKKFEALRLQNLENNLNEKAVKLIVSGESKTLRQEIKFATDFFAMLGLKSEIVNLDTKNPLLSAAADPTEFAILICSKDDRRQKRIAEIVTKLSEQGCKKIGVIGEEQATETIAGVQMIAIREQGHLYEQLMQWMKK